MNKFVELSNESSASFGIITSSICPLNVLDDPGLFPIKYYYHSQKDGPLDISTASPPFIIIGNTYSHLKNDYHPPMMPLSC